MVEKHDVSDSLQVTNWTSKVSNPKLVRCRRKSLVPKHLVNKSATLSVPARCSTKRSFALILAFIQPCGFHMPTSLWECLNLLKAAKLTNCQILKKFEESLSRSSRRFQHTHDDRNCQMPSILVQPCATHTILLHVVTERSFTKHNSPRNTLPTIEPIRCKRGI